MERLGRVADPFDWIGTVPALAIVVLMATGVIPVWTLVVALLLSFRLAVRLVVRLADAFI